MFQAQYLPGSSSDALQIMKTTYHKAGITTDLRHSVRGQLGENVQKSALTTKLTALRT